MNKLLLGRKYADLRKGYPVNINDVTIRAFTAKKDGQPIAFGELLVRTTEPRVYEGVVNAATVTDANEIVGINLATNVKLAKTYGDNQSAELQPGQQGDNAQIGEVAVKYVGDAPLENSPVYLITVAGTNPGQDKGLVTSVSTSIAALGTKLELPQFRFTGLVDTATGLAVLRKLY